LISQFQIKELITKATPSGEATLDHSGLHSTWVRSANVYRKEKANARADEAIPNSLRLIDEI
jgi:hypothetical protein